TECSGSRESARWWKTTVRPQITNLYCDSICHHSTTEAVHFRPGSALSQSYLDVSFLMICIFVDTTSQDHLWPEERHSMTEGGFLTDADNLGPNGATAT
ncbi:hypothetical protein WG66_005405, partial [Moniliophthora roreri]